MLFKPKENKQTSKLLTRILTFTLALAMTITPLSTLDTYTPHVHATSDNNNYGDGQGDMGTTTDSKAWSANYQGYRMYIINSNLERISPTYDFVFSNPGNIEKLYSTRFDSTISPDEHYVFTVNKLKNWTKSSKDVPTPTKKSGGSRVGNGAEFKNWFFNGAAGTVIPGKDPLKNPTGLNPYGDADGDGVRNAIDPKPYDPTVPGKTGDGGGFVDINPVDIYCDKCGKTESNCTCSPVGTICPVCGVKLQLVLEYPCDCGKPKICTKCYIPSCDGSCDKTQLPCPFCGRSFVCIHKCMLCGEYAQNINTHECIKVSKCEKCGKEGKHDCPYDAKRVKELNDRTGCDFAYYPTSDNAKVQDNIEEFLDMLELTKWQFWKSDEKRIQAIGGNTIKEARIAMMSTTVGTELYNDYNEDIKVVYTALTIIKGALKSKSSSINNLDILNQNIPLAGGGEGMPVYNLVNKGNTIKPVGYANAYLALQDGGYLIVEPITWLNLQTYGVPGGSRRYNTYRTYGTYWNLATSWGGAAKGSFYNTVMTKLFNNCMAVGKDITTKSGRKIHAVTDASSQKDVDTMLGLINSGYGASMHAYSANDFDSSGTSTYDEPKGRTPAPAPDDPISDLQKEDKSFIPGNIVKFYKDGLGEQAVWLSYTQKETPRTIDIESEPEYIVSEWFTSTELKEANDNSRDPNPAEPTYDAYKSALSSKIKQTGTNTKTGLELKTGETTLYVLLVRSNASSKAEYTIEESEISKPVNPNMSGIEIPVEVHTLDMECKGHCTHTCNNDCEKYCSHKASGCTSCAAKCGHPSGCTTCESYCSHKHTESACGKDGKSCKHVCGPNRCKESCEHTHTVAECGKDYKACKHKCKQYCDKRCGHPSGCTNCVKYCSHSSCSNCAERCGHPSGCTGKNSDGTKKSCYGSCTFTLDDKSITLKLKNLNTGKYPQVIANTSGFAPKLANSATVNRETLKDEMLYAKGFNFSFIAYRGSDKLTYASYKTIDLPAITDKPFGFKSGEKPNGTRKKSDYTEAILVDLKSSSSDLKTTAKGSKGCENKDTATPPSEFTDGSGNYLNDSDLRYNISILIKTYSGEDREPDHSINTNPKLKYGSSGTKRVMGRMLSTGNKITFYPYVRMTYAGYSGTKTNVKVLSEYQREIYPNDYAEIGWTFVENNLLLQSQMWATDANYTKENNDRPWAGTNQVLKGGASLQLRDKENANKVELITYQTLLEGEARDISKLTGTYELKASQAKEYHKTFVETAIKTFDKAEIVQYVNTNPEVAHAWEGGLIVNRGSNISSLNNGAAGGKASTEKKYYLESAFNQEKNAQRADVDVKQLAEDIKYYRFYTKVNGEVWMEVSKENASGSRSVTSNNRILEKHQTVDDLTNSTAKNINLRTGAVTKLLAALERDTGNDKTASWVSDGHWYNEAYYGITVIVQKTTINVGLNAGNTPLRTMVIDPKLVPYIASKGDQVNKDSIKAFSTAFKLNLNENNAISQFKGQDVFMSEPDMLIHSRDIYITNMTVDDNR